MLRRPRLTRSCLRSSGEMAKQMKVKKLKNLKTLDSKPGKLLLFPAACFWAAALSQRLCLHVGCAGVYSAYKPYLNKDEEIIKQLQKVSPSAGPQVAAGSSRGSVW